MAKREAGTARKVARAAGGPVLQDAALRIVDRRAMATGTVALPCLPALLDRYVGELDSLWRTLGRSFGNAERAQLRDTLAKALTQGFEHSPHTLLVVQYQAHPAPKANLEYSVHLKTRSVEAYYEEWSNQPGGAWFGSGADAKVLDVARSLPSASRILDVGAGHGRNALPLARLGLSVDALELVDTLCARLRESAHGESLALTTVCADLLSPELTLPCAPYDLIVMSEVTSHLRDVAQLRSSIAKLADALAPGGLLLFNVFLAEEGYTPDKLIREASQAALSTLFTRPELFAITRAHELTLVSDESVCTYEQTHLEPGAWPPTSWFELWARGRNVVDLPSGDVPFELRWLAFRKGG